MRKWLIGKEEHVLDVYRIVFSYPARDGYQNHSTQCQTSEIASRNVSDIIITIPLSEKERGLVRVTQVS